ncbi:MAG TPA: FAD-dependent monooxygenase [Verrucomicrobiae bacterium]|nr:FAD-dependent monooxygenase [Verrucomicrobiae bacterium]
MSEFDVIVVGGGPAGAAAATFCARRGWHVALFEHARFPRHKVCGNVINPNCWPVLEHCGVAEKVQALPQFAVRGATFTAMDQSTLQIDRRTNDGRFTAIRRYQLDATLLEHARASGATVFEDDTIHGIEPGRAVVAHSGRYVARKGLVGADGRHSIVAQAAGLARNVGRGNEYIAFQGHFPLPKAMDDRVQLHLFPGGYCGLVGMDGGCVNLCIVAGREHVRHRDDCPTLFAHTAGQNPHFRALGIVPEPVEALHCVHPVCLPANAPARDGIFLVGDALRVMEPFTGQGIFFALRTAELAVEAMGGSHRAEAAYAAAVARFWRERARTNEWLRRLMYHERTARVVIRALRNRPWLTRPLADNVLGEARRFR